MGIVKNFIRVLLPHINPKPDHEGSSGKPESPREDASTYDSDIEDETLVNSNCPALPSSDVLSCVGDADILINLIKPPTALVSQLEYFHEIDLGGLIFVLPFVDMELQGLYEVVFHLEAVPKAETGSPEARLLGYIYYFIFMRTGVIEDLDKAIDMNRIAITGADAKSPDYFPCWKNIVVMLLKKYSCTDSLSDLMQAIMSARELGKLEFCVGRQRDAEVKDMVTMHRFRAAKSALKAILQGGDVEFAFLEEQRTLFICQLEVTFEVVNRCMQNFKESNAADLQLAISASEQFFSTYHSKRIKDPEFSYSFGWKVIHYYLLPIETRYHQTNDIKDLQAAIDIYQAVCSNPSQEDIGILLYHQASLLRDKFEYMGDISDLQSAINIYQDAEILIPDDDEHKVKVLEQLEYCLLLRGHRVGSLKDWDMGLKHQLQALEKIPPDSREFKLAAKTLDMVPRYMHAQKYGGYDKSERFRKAAQVASEEGSRSGCIAKPPPHGRDQEYKAAISLLDFLATTPGLVQDFNIEDLQAFIRKQRDFLDSLAVKAPNKSRELSNKLDLIAYVPGEITLADLLSQRYSKTKNREDLDEAIYRLEKAISTVHGDHQVRGELLSSHARLFSLRFMHRLHELGKSDRDKDSSDALSWIYEFIDDLAHAYHYYREAALLSSARIVTRVTAAIHTSYLSMIGGKLDETLRFAELAAKLFPLMPSRQLDQQEQQINISGLSWVASSSASFTLFGGGGAYNAIRVLELARGVITGLRLEMRSDLTELKLRHPDMAAQFEKFREILDSTTSISTDPTFADNDQTSSINENRLQELRHRTNIELNKLVDQIRLLPNFNNFLLLPEEHQLMIAANWGPIILINVSWLSSEAIFIERGSIRSIDLPKLKMSDLDKKVNIFQSALSRNGGSDILTILKWLWKVAAGPILDSLGFVAPPSEGNDWPHVWWIPTGKLSLLPIHAAGHHIGQKSTDTVLDRVISSYCSSIKSLLYSRQNDWQANPETGSVKSLLVAMDETPGHSSLRKNSTTPWLAYLSACSTSNNNAEELYDEGLHLVTSFQLAGFRHVIGTLWDVSDEYCVDAAKAIYETILEREIGNDLGVALGVHKASRLLRDRAYLRDRQRHAAFEEEGEEEVRGKGKGRAQEDLRRLRPFGYPEPDKVEINSPLIWAAYVHVGA
ncbi:hypothetical protein TWF173_010345 [Orbilia oligospora]|nr:hypothetical protein TWF173_010345 [Orbilia oligospora]